MRHEVISCDRCRAEQQNSDSFNWVHGTWSSEHSVRGKLDPRTLDLCPSCVEACREFFETVSPQHREQRLYKERIEAKYPDSEWDFDPRRGARGMFVNKTDGRAESPSFD